MFNLHHMFLFTVLLPDRSIAALREMPHYIAQGVLRAQRRKTNKEKQDAVGTFFQACFLPRTSRSHVLCAYCNFESKQAISITLFGRRQGKQKRT